MHSARWGMSGNTADVHLSRSLGLGDVVLYFVTACSSLQWVATAGRGWPEFARRLGHRPRFAMFLPVSVCTVALAARYPDEGWDVRLEQDGVRIVCRLPDRLDLLDQ